MHACGINPFETYIRSGLFAWKPSLPYTPGSDTSGIVESVGRNVNGFKVMDVFSFWPFFHLPCLFGHMGALLLASDNLHDGTEWSGVGKIILRRWWVFPSKQSSCICCRLQGYNIVRWPTCTDIGNDDLYVGTINFDQRLTIFYCWPVCAIIFTVAQNWTEGND